MGLLGGCLDEGAMLLAKDYTEAVLRPISQTAYPVDPKVGNVRNEGAELINLIQAR